jgi:hypothetical protein
MTLGGVGTAHMRPAGQPAAAAGSGGGGAHGGSRERPMAVRREEVLLKKKKKKFRDGMMKDTSGPTTVANAPAPREEAAPQLESSIDDVLMQRQILGFERIEFVPPRLPDPMLDSIRVRLRHHVATLPDSREDEGGSP